MREDATPLNETVLFFDGHCGLCNRAVDFLIAHDNGHRFFFAPLQGSTAAARLSRDLIPDTLKTSFSAKNSPATSGSVVLLENGKIFVRSDAVLRALVHIGGVWKGVQIFRLVPRILRDTLYDLVARNRTRWFGRKADCRVPSASERARFLP